MQVFLVIILSLSASVIFYILFETIVSKLYANRLAIERRIEEAKYITRHGLDKVEDSSSVLERLFRPITQRFVEMFTLLVPRNAKSLQSTEIELKRAGLKITAREYRASLIMSMVFSTVGGFVLGIVAKQNFLMICLFGLGGLYGSYALKKYSLSAKITKRKEEIYHELPEMMDLLSVSVSSGLGFDQAIAYIVSKSKGPLYDELGLAQRDMTLGRSRREALRSFADRCENIEIQTFVTAVLQADEMGASLQNVLTVQSETIRDSHKAIVEEKAQKLSVKMLIPMVAFIFPVIFIVLMGPAVLSIVNSGAL